MISIVIPTLNEGEYLEETLSALKNQTYQDFEIIVSDSKSEDDTQKIAGKYGARIVVSERRGPAFGRNRGAEVAKGDVLLFLDADTILSRTALEGIDKTMKEKEVAAGTCAFYPLRGGPFDWLLFALANAAARIMIRFGVPQDPGNCGFYRREIYEKMGGIREDLKLNETHDLAMRTRPYGNFVYIKVPAFTSLRRYKKAGYMETIMIYLKAAITYFNENNVPDEKFYFPPVR